MTKQDWVLQYMAVTREPDLDAALKAWEKIHDCGGDPHAGESFTRQYKLPHGTVIKIGGIPCAIVG